MPYIEVKNPTAQIEHEATTSKISEDQLFYAMSRGLDAESAVALIVNGFAREVLKQLPMEFAVEAQKLLGIQLGGERGMTLPMARHHGFEVQQVECRSLVGSIQIREVSRSNWAKTASGQLGSADRLVG